ncbi:hypothetical protein Tco_0393242 [Tanacetum coccineum]
MFLLGLLALAIDAACAFRAEEMPSLISCRMAAKVMAGVSDVDVLLGGILSTQDNANKEISGSNSSDGGNIRDGVKIAGEVIGSGDEIGAEVEHPEPRFTYETEEIRAILDVVQSNDLYNMMMLRLVPFSKENVNIQYESVMGRNPKVNQSKLVSKYAFLWPDSLLLSTDSHNVLLSSTALQVWIVIKVHLHDQRRFLVYPLMEQYNFRSFLSVFAGGVIVDEVSLIIKLFAYDHRVSFTNHAFSTYFINLLGMFDGIPPKSEGSRQSFPFTTKFKIRLHLLDSDRWQNLWASSVKVPVANVTLSSSALLAMSENTDSVCSNQRMRNFFRSSVSIKIVGICNGSSLLLPGCRNPASKLPG